MSAKTALCLLYKDKAQVVDPHYNVYSFMDWLKGKQQVEELHPKVFNTINTPSITVLVPHVIRLLDYTDTPTKWRIKFSRYHILIRDNYKCQYCGIELQRSTFTIDHILPRSRGGKTDWDNCVAACKSCNRAKDDKLLEETGMKLLHGIPRKPDYDFRTTLKQHKVKEWDSFI